jgi:hypothetical protein
MPEKGPSVFTGPTLTKALNFRARFQRWKASIIEDYLFFFRGGRRRRLITNPRFETRAWILKN